ncbi:MAG TPA: hypothetical protein VKU01_34190 [Bryobacteraceae bacterium]|nr:hypothetical protein [Bryobacteraceae bacterium]
MTILRPYAVVATTLIFILTAALPATAGTIYHHAIAVNIATNKVYSLNSDGTIAVTDGATGSSTTILVGGQPSAIVVNPVTNKIYVAVPGSASVVIVDGATNATSSVSVGPAPFSLALNPITNKIYVGVSGAVTAIDGATNSTSAIALGASTSGIAVNPLTNMIYATSDGASTDSLFIVDGTTQNVSTIAVGQNPVSVAVNPATNKIYVASFNSSTISVVDGVSGRVSNVTTSGPPTSIVVNPVTNKIYALAQSSLAVLDSNTNSTTTIAGAGGLDVVLNALTNKVYVAAVSSILVIDGATNSTSTLTGGVHNDNLGVNPITNKIYSADGATDGLTIVDGAAYSFVTTPLPAPTDPNFPFGTEIGINPATKKIYIGSWFGTVSIVDGTTSSIETVDAGNTPDLLAINPSLNKVYAADPGGFSITVIDGSGNTSFLDADGINALASNPVTNRLYVANRATVSTRSGGLTFFNADDSVTVVDETTGTATIVALNEGASAMAVNPATNKVYIATLYNSFSNIPGDVAVLDGPTNRVTTIHAGILDQPFMAVNPATNKIYILSGNPGVPGQLTEIDGATNTFSQITVGKNPSAVAVNPAVNRIYVANTLDNTVTVVDGASHATSTVAVGSTPLFLAVNPLTNKIYVGNSGGNTITVIDGSTNATSTVDLGFNPSGMAVDMASNRVYVVTSFPDALATITEQPFQSVPLSLNISPLPANRTLSVSPSFTFNASPAAKGVYYQVDTWQKTWIRASGANGTFTGAVTILQPGPHFLYAFADDGQSATQTGSPLVSNITAYWFIVSAPNVTGIAGSRQSVSINSTFPTLFQVLVTDGGEPLANVPVTFSAPQSGPSGVFSGTSQSPIVTTNAAGIATAPTFSANGTTGGPYLVSAITPGAVSPAVFSLTNGAATVNVTLQTSPPNLLVSLDDGPLVPAPLTAQLAVGSSHTWTTQPFQAGASGIGYAFGSWSDGSFDATGPFSVPNTSASFTAQFKIQYLLMATSNNVNAFVYVPGASTGILAPGAFVSQYYDPGSTVSLQAESVFNTSFLGWNGPVADPTAPLTSVLLDAPKSVTAVFTTPLLFVPRTPCRIADTRGFGFTGVYGSPTLAAGTMREIPILASPCGIPVGPAFSLNVTAVPSASLNYLTLWQSGQPQPLVSTLNSPNGQVVANAAIVPSEDKISLYVSDASDVIVDINGYFTNIRNGGLAFYPVTPCRVADTRGSAGALGGPSLTANSTRGFPISSSTCGIPATAQAYSLNMTAVPQGRLGYLTVWPSGQPQPFVSTLNATDGRIVANAAIVAAGTNGAVNLFASDPTDVVIDINGYFAAPGAPGAMSFNPIPPCRVADTRNANGPLGAPAIGPNGVRSFPVQSSSCVVPANTAAYSLNMTAVPAGPLTYLSVWPAGQPQPFVSTLNSLNGGVVANAAIVPAGTNGAISVFSTGATNLVIDINGFFTPIP